MPAVLLVVQRPRPCPPSRAATIVESARRGFVAPPRSQLDSLHHELADHSRFGVALDCAEDRVLPRLVDPESPGIGRIGHRVEVDPVALPSGAATIRACSTAPSFWSSMRVGSPARIARDVGANLNSLALTRIVAFGASSTAAVGRVACACAPCSCPECSPPIGSPRGAGTSDKSSAGYCAWRSAMPPSSRLSSRRVADRGPLLGLLDDYGQPPLKVTENSGPAGVAVLSLPARWPVSMR